MLRYKKDFKLRELYSRKFLLHSAMALTLTSGLSYVFGFLRDRILTQTFGVGRELDIYYASFVLPDILLAIFVTSCVSAVLVPMLTDEFKKGKREAGVYFYNILSVILGVIVGLIILGELFIPYGAKYLVPGFNQVEVEQYILLVRIMLLSPFIFALSNFFGGVLIARKDFFFYGVAPVFYNGGIILGILFLAPKYGIIGVAWGTIFGALLHLFSRAVIARKRIGIRLLGKDVWQWNDKTKKTFYLMLPKILQIGAWQGLLAWFVFLASYFKGGDVTVYSLARNFQSMPVSLIGIAIATSTFATLSSLATQKHWKKFHGITKEKIWLVVLLTSLAAILLAWGGKFLIAFLFAGKSFDKTAINRIAMVLALYSFSVPLESVMHLLARAHYALKETRRPSLIHIFSIVVIICVGWYGRGQGVYIIPISFAVGLVVQDLLLWISYKQLIGKVIK